MAYSDTIVSHERVRTSLGGQLRVLPDRSADVESQTIVMLDLHSSVVSKRTSSFEPLAQTISTFGGLQ